jgi:ABC-type bacteriocin/lantibiotic exporter with double-glycine peptidase domain
MWRSSDDPLPDKSKKITTIRVFTAASLLALVISIPAIVVTVLMHYILKASLILTFTTSFVTLFLLMGLGYKLSKKLAKVQQ